MLIYDLVSGYCNSYLIIVLLIKRKRKDETMILVLYRMYGCWFTIVCSTYLSLLMFLSPPTVIKPWLWPIWSLISCTKFQKYFPIDFVTPCHNVWIFLLLLLLLSEAVLFENKTSELLYSINKKISRSLQTLLLRVSLLLQVYDVNFNWPL